MTILPSIAIELRVLRIASQAARSAICSSPLPMNRAAASAAASVARTTSSARFRSIPCSVSISRGQPIAPEQRGDQRVPIIDSEPGHCTFSFSITTRRSIRTRKIRGGHQRKWYRLGRMGLELRRGGVVGHEKNRKVTEAGEPLNHRPDYQLVDSFDRLGL